MLGKMDYWVIIYFSGIVYYNFFMVFQSVCFVNVFYFFMDIQICIFKFGLWFYSGVEFDFYLSIDQGRLISKQFIIDFGIFFGVYGLKYILFIFIIKCFIFLIFRGLFDVMICCYCWVGRQLFIVFCVFNRCYLIFNFIVEYFLEFLFYVVCLCRSILQIVCMCISIYLEVMCVFIV